MVEEWKTIYDRYEISNKGRLRKLAYSITNCDGKTLNFKAKLMSDIPQNMGYINNSLTINGEYKRRSRHQLVAMAFLDHKINGYDLIVDHIDNNKLNNRVDNLQVVTCRTNLSKDRKGTTSKYQGVHWSKSANKWRARFTSKGKGVSLGFYDKEEDAANAYNNALEYFNNTGLMPTKITRHGN